MEHLLFDLMVQEFSDIAVDDSDFQEDQQCASLDVQIINPFAPFNRRSSLATAYKFQEK